MQNKARITQMTVLPEGGALFSEFATKVTIVDEAAGEFVEVEQSRRIDLGKIAINPDEWPALRKAIDLMVRGCQPDRSEES